MNRRDFFKGAAALGAMLVMPLTFAQAMPPRFKWRFDCAWSAEYEAWINTWTTRVSNRDTYEYIIMTTDHIDTLPRALRAEYLSQRDYAMMRKIKELGL